MKVGELYKFGWVYNGCRLNRKLAVYLGPDFIHRSDGEWIENHRVLVVGDSESSLIDRGLLGAMRVYSESR